LYTIFPLTRNVASVGVTRIVNVFSSGFVVSALAARLRMASFAVQLLVTAQVESPIRRLTRNMASSRIRK